MKISKYFTILLLALSCYNVYGQTDPILLTVNGKPINKSDFEYAYKKANSSTSSEKQSLQLFLQNFIDFKLKVEEAQHLQLNEDEIFKKEYLEYLEATQKPYIVDSISIETIAKKTYKRLGENIQLCQLFIDFPNEQVLPKDTLEIYNKIKSIREEAIQGGSKKFEELILNYSEDSVSRNASIPGYIGWKTALMLDPKIENTMYSLTLDSISQPIRTNHGYYLIKALNKRPDVGQISLSHIFFPYPEQNSTSTQQDSVRRQARIIYEGLIDGANFDKTASVYSSDFQTSDKGGALGWFGVSNPLPSVFEEVLYNLNAGDISQPFEMDYGLHIFKIVDKKGVLPWEDLKENITTYIQKGSRNEQVKELEIERLENLFPYTLNSSTYNQLESITRLYHIADTSYFEKTASLDDLLLLTIGNKEYKVIDFVNFLIEDPSTYFTLSTDILTHKIDDFILKKLQETQKASLNELYPELRLLTSEYYEGLLLFEVMNREIWNKSQSDTQSLQKLFNENPAKYKWESPKYKGYIIHAKDKETLKKAKKIIREQSSHVNLNQVLYKQLNNDSIKNVYIEQGIWAKGENAFVDKKIFKLKNNREIIGYPESLISGKLISIPETLDDVRGVVVSEQQTILEKKWLESLRKKYKVEINEDVLNEIK